VSPVLTLERDIMATGLWVTVRDLGPDWETSDYAQEAVKSASYLMWALSGRKFTGVHSVTERYVRFAPLINTRLIQEAAILNSRVNKALSVIEPWVSAETRIRLRGQPVQNVVTVRNVSGEIVNPDSYYMVDHSTLQFSDGALIVPADIEISYTYGAEPPTMGKMAARRVAIEFIKLWTGNEDCALPQRLTNVTRQGVTFTVMDSQDFLEEMRLGIYEVDLFLKTINPNKAQKRSKVFSPDIPKARRYTPAPLNYSVSELDIVVSKTGGSVTINLASIDAEFLVNESGWEPELVIRSANGFSTLSLGSTAVTYADGNVTLSVPYMSAYSVLKLTRVGVWDFYATKNGTKSLISSANLTVDLTI
jgi:hypothetical protein